LYAGEIGGSTLNIWLSQELLMAAAKSNQVNPCDFTTAN